jgi:hypothetical protein
MTGDNASGNDDDDDDDEDGNDDDDLDEFSHLCMSITVSLFLFVTSCYLIGRRVVLKL